MRKYNKRPNPRTRMGRTILLACSTSTPPTPRSAGEVKLRKRFQVLLRGPLTVFLQRNLQSASFEANDRRSSVKLEYQPPSSQLDVGTDWKPVKLREETLYQTQAINQIAYPNRAAPGSPKRPNSRSFSRCCTIISSSAKYAFRSSSASQSTWSA